MQYITKTNLIILFTIFLMFILIGFKLSSENNNTKKGLSIIEKNRFWNNTDTDIFIQYIKERLLGFGLLGIIICVWLYSAIN